jgi:hypothetical protein
MSLDDLLDDFVVFAFLDWRDAHALSARLTSSWATWVEPRSGSWLVGVEVRPGVDDFAVLLHDVVEWLAARDIRAIAFHVDGRVYTLSPPARTVTTAV